MRLSPKHMLQQSHPYEDVGDFGSFGSTEGSSDRMSSEDDNYDAVISRHFEGWSTSTGVHDSRFKDEDEMNSSLMTSFINWREGLSTAQKILYLLGALAGLIILAAAILVFQEWGLTPASETQLNASENRTYDFDSPSLTRAPGSDASGEPPLLWARETHKPSSTPLPPSLLYPNQPSPTQAPPSTAAPSPPTTTAPTDGPTTSPTKFPTQQPTLSPTSGPTVEHSSGPTDGPTANPTSRPTTSPTNLPTTNPTTSPTNHPTTNPTTSPTTRPSVGPTVNPTDPKQPTYVPGNLIVQKLGLLLSEGLDARLLAEAGERVEYDLGGTSRDKFHEQADAGATFPDERPNNPGGWIYVSNSEVENRKGGVGAFTFDRDANLLNYEMLLERSSMNCGGGRTPWNTWVSCEEVEFDGLIYQVDPTGERDPQVMTLGSDGGRWESFAYDVRDLSRPRYFATEDHNKGTVRRFTPDNPNWDEPWDMLHGPGTTDFLMIFPNSTRTGGTFIWTNDKEGAKNNARAFYPQTEGIDVYGNQLFYVCKNIRQLFVLNLDDGTYYNHTTVNGLFDGKPDQITRFLGDSRELLYFTEEGGRDSGVHARDHLGRFYTVFESPVFPDETTGLSFSPDGRFMYTAYQNTGKLFQIWRTDGFPFQAAHLDVKYHQPSRG